MAGIRVITSLLVAFGLVIAARADTLTVPASLDNTLYEDPLGGLSNGVGWYMFVGETATQNTRRAIIAFDVDDIPTGSIVNSVTMHLTCSMSSSSSRPIQLRRTLASWGEGQSDAGIPGGTGAEPQPGDATWLHRFYPDVLWASPGGDISPLVSASTNVGGSGPYSWSAAGMVSDVQSWVDGTAENYGWVLVGAENGGRSAKRFDTRENMDDPNDLSNRPRLVIDYTVPEPASLLLLGLGIFAVTRRR